MSRRESGQGRRRGPSQAMFFDEEWHPDQCACTQCHQEEQQVLSQFENEMNRLEDEVQKSNVFTSTCPRHIETEWQGEGRASQGVSGRSTKPPEVAPTPHNPPVLPNTSGSQTESWEREEIRDSENTQWTRPQEQQERNSSAAATHASDDDVGLSFAREMYQHYEVRHVMHEQWPPEQTWSDERSEDELHHYSNGIIHHQLSGNSHPHSHDDSCEELNYENNNNHHNHYHHNCHHSPSIGRRRGGGRFSAANQERYNNSISAKKSKRKFTPSLKDTIKRRYKTLPSQTFLASVSHVELDSSLPRWPHPPSHTTPSKPVDP